MILNDDSGNILVNGRTHVKIEFMEKEFSNTSFEGDRRSSLLRHRQQKTWQILTPLFLGVLLILAIAVLVILTTAGTIEGGSVSQWADTSIIWIISPVMMFVFIGALVLFGLVYLIGKLIKIMPPYANLIQGYAQLIAARVNLATRKAASPFVKTGSTIAGLKGFFSALLGKTHH